MPGLTEAFDRVTGSLANATNLIEVLDVVDVLNDMVVGAHPVLRCPDGCSRCCNQQIIISEDEWAHFYPDLYASTEEGERRRIVQAAQRLTDPKHGVLKVAMRAKTPAAFKKEIDALGKRRVNPCVLLLPDGLCRVYANRPMICRAYARVARNPGQPMLCLTLNAKLKEQGIDGATLELPDYMPIGHRYFRTAHDDMRYTVMPVHVLAHIGPDGDLIPEARPLPRDGSLPVFTREEARIF